MRPSSPGSTPASTTNSFGVPLVQAILGAAVVTVAMQYISFCDIYSIEDSYILFVSSSALCPMEEQLALLAAKCPLSWKKKMQTKLIDILCFLCFFFFLLQTMRPKSTRCWTHLVSFATCRTIVSSAQFGTATIGHVRFLRRFGKRRHP